MQDKKLINPNPPALYPQQKKHVFSAVLLDIDGYLFNESSDGEYYGTIFLNCGYLRIVIARGRSGKLHSGSGYQMALSFIFIFL